MSKCLYIGEGETEKRFIHFLRENDYIEPGKFVKFNLMQSELRKTSHIFAIRYAKIVCVIDTDCCADDNLNKFFANIKNLKTVCKKSLYVAIQNKNFEDELCYILECKNLGDFFKLKYKSVADIKNFLTNKVVYSNYVNKDKAERYCCRPKEFIELLRSRGLSCQFIIENLL